MRKNVFGLDIQYDTWNHKDDLPLYLINMSLQIETISSTMRSGWDISRNM